MAKTKKAKRKKSKASPDPLKDQKRIQRIHFREVRSIFATCGFQRIASASDQEITYQGTTSDFDDIFIRDNVVVISECTTTKPSELSSHLKRKKVLYDKIAGDPAAFLKFLNGQFPEFVSAQNKKFQPHHYRVVIVYCSRFSIEQDLKDEVPNVKYLDYPVVQYFKAIADRVKQSARFELFNFLSISHKDIGDAVISPAASALVSYKGSILPEGQSHFPPGFKVVSFYVDPEALLQRCYVLRKDGWRSDDGLYQRMIGKSKVEAIRKYLLSKKRVFINNIIVTLPSGTLLTRDDGTTLDAAKITKTEPGNIQLPSGHNSIGLIDGQHRVFSYYEGGKNEADISILRAQQNLLVTGIIYPQKIDAADRAKFEATLFLEINATQTNAKSDLKQAIGVLLEPFSQDSIARRIIGKLNENGPLAEQFERYFFDKAKIKTTSIVSYGLKPLVKLVDSDSLFAGWKDANKLSLINGPSEALVDSYVKFCASQINVFVGAVKSSIPPERWTTNKKIKGRMLTTTVLNGLFVCLRMLAANNQLHAFDWYKTKFSAADLSKFNFSSYKSSQYGSLGEALYNKYF